MQSSDIKLVYSGVVNDLAPNAMPPNALIIKSLAVSGDKWENRSGQSNFKKFMFRISKQYLRTLYAGAERGSAVSCETISDLYMSGLGLPKDKYNGIIWRNLAGYDAVQIGETVFKLKDMLKVLRIHINRNSKLSDVYLTSHEYLSLMTKISEFNISELPIGTKLKSVPMLKMKPNLYDVYAVYKNIGNETQLVSVFLSFEKIKEGKPHKKLIDFTYQGSVLVPKTLPLFSFGKNEGYYVVYGKLDYTFDDDYAKRVHDWIRLDVDRLEDVYREKADKNSPHTAWLDQYRHKNGLASLCINEFKHIKRPTKKEIERAASAKRLIEAFEKRRIAHRELRRAARAEAKKIDPLASFQFKAIDLVLCSPELELIKPNTTYENIRSKLEKLGFDSYQIKYFDHNRPMTRFKNQLYALRLNQWYCLTK